MRRLAAHDRDSILLRLTQFTNSDFARGTPRRDGIKKMFAVGQKNGSLWEFSISLSLVAGETSPPDAATR